jgi:hypothetical protein
MAQRMAGEELTKYGSLGDRFGEDYVDRVKGDGRQDGNKYSRKELASEFRFGRGDTSVDDTVAKYQDMVDSGKFKGNNKAQGFLEMHGVNFGNGEDPADVPEPEVTPTPTVDDIDIDTGSGPVDMTPNPFAGGSVGLGGQSQTVVQDNDQTSTVVGNGNTVTQNQDNSISQNGFNSEKAAKATGLKDNYILNLINRKGI